MAVTYYDCINHLEGFLTSHLGCLRFLAQQCSSEQSPGEKQLCSTGSISLLLFPAIKKLNSLENTKRASNVCQGIVEGACWCIFTLLPQLSLWVGFCCLWVCLVTSQWLGPRQGFFFQCIHCCLCHSLVS